MVHVALLDGHTLEEISHPDLTGINIWAGNLGRVAWSLDGKILFAGGSYHDKDGSPVLSWSNAGAGERRILRANTNTVLSLSSLPDGGLLVAAGDWLGRLRPDGRTAWTRGLQAADFRNQFDKLLVSSDGMRVGFGFAAFGTQAAGFDAVAHSLVLNPPVEWHMAPPLFPGRYPTRDWHNTPNLCFGVQC